MVNYTDAELRYIDKLDEYKARSIEAFDRNLLALSAGSILLSVTFVKVFIKKIPADHDLTLILSWLFFLTTILLVLVSYLFGIRSFDNEFDNIKAKNKSNEIKGGNSGEEKQERGKKRNYNKVIRNLRFGSGATFFVGLVLLVSFSISNLRGDHMSENDRVDQIDNGDSENRSQDQSYIKSLETPFNTLDDGDDDTSQDSQQDSQDSDEGSSKTNGG